MNKKCFSVAAGFLLAGAFASAPAQTTTAPTQPAATQQTPATPAPQAQNLPTQLNFTREQVEQWRAINREFRNPEIAADLKFRQARLALADAMEAPTPNEELIKQRAKDLADAQSAKTQLQALRQARVLQMLTPEQRIKLKEIREEIRVRNQDLKRQQQGVNGLNQRQPLKRANAQGIMPAQRRALRQQQKQKP
jgi:Spy/CpxP family protein refolding chaperone